MSKTKIKILNKGAIISNYAYIQMQSENIVAIGIDLKSKYPDSIGIGEDGMPCVSLFDGEDTLYIDNKLKGIGTTIGFPEFKGWAVWTAHCSKYTVYICLIK